MSAPAPAADDQVELFKVKKLIKSLQAARGYVRAVWTTITLAMAALKKHFFHVLCYCNIL